MTVELASAAGIRRRVTDSPARIAPPRRSAAARAADRHGLAADEVKGVVVGGSRGGVSSPASHADGQAGGLQPHQLRAVLDRIETRLAEALQIRDLAAIATLSARRFTTAFKRSVGITPHRYVLERRVRRAAWLLALSQQSIADVAYQVGFSSQAHFTTMFGKHVGMTPGAFRTSRRTVHGGGAGESGS